MKFTIITPSFNQLDYLKRCIASVHDQISGEALKRPVGLVGSVEAAQSASLNELNGFNDREAICVHHHIQDGGSSDGTADWLRLYQSKVESGKWKDNHPGYSFSFASEADAGMYDALNKGISFALDRLKKEQLCVERDAVAAWLNCDEQYLPGALQKVSGCFMMHPENDMLCGDTLLVDPDGTLLTCRKNPPLRRAYILADHLYAQSAGLFFRASVFSSGFRFNPAWRAVGDCDLVVRALESGSRPVHIRSYLAACTMTGENLSRRSVGVQELKAFCQSAPRQYRLGRPWLNLLRYAEKFVRGGYHQASPLKYELYAGDSDLRKRFVAQQPGCRFTWGMDE
jgi:glycosyltransferase involved in cell wall biosynthesis